MRREEDRLDRPLEEVDVRHARVGDVALCEREHLVGHVEPVRRAVGPTRFADSSTSMPRPSPGRAPSPRAALRPRSVPAAERGQDGGVGQRVALLRRVERLAEQRLVLLAVGAAGQPAAAARAVRHGERGFRIATLTSSRSSSAGWSWTTRSFQVGDRRRRLGRRRASARSTPTCHAARARAALLRRACAGGVNVGWARPSGS